MTETIEITGDFMTLTQLLKETGIIATGGQAKWYLSEFAVYIDGEQDQRRGRKIYPGSVVEVPAEEAIFQLVSASDAALDDAHDPR
ncbi:S4 domain-containing protein YaaA [Aerococcus sanguinicola]|uniref:S4 domain-containing protein YaaA n=1 Tax=unclassified Aerococcus TaxID=2618060 RepID=UPI0008A2EBF4|nr:MULTISPECIES: S4 domain-containing protein YaaA [unclassified Aerococcus]KAB0646748.1 S4 domain-containing protein YaaA [Aerococcus sanguinicola]MDK6233897.1 S4 domain-containing protein YaaA [Aerococcus sp. UMB10185]MDK6856571.1 S4 domain-containing protein YaaA [Aerococcus sp. UMB7533]MDK8502761.1 S4 domain-containing protein YaaA [Aerococcus sp. UMB1112A]OFN01218.1 RNA-binding protein [Aerococcus sp. HMSC062A02]